MLLGDAVRRRRDPAAPEVLPSDVILNRVERSAGLDRRRAQRALEAVLERLAERVAGGEVDDLAAFLPAELRPPLERGRDRTGGKAQRMSLDDFIVRVAGREGVSVEQALNHAQGVFAALREAIPRQGVVGPLDELPRSYAEALT